MRTQNKVLQKGHKIKRLTHRLSLFAFFIGPILVAHNVAASECKIENIPTCIAGDLKTIIQDCSLVDLTKIFNQCPRDTLLVDIPAACGKMASCDNFQTDSCLRLKRDAYLSKVKKACVFLANSQASHDYYNTPSSNTTAQKAVRQQPNITNYPKTTGGTTSLKPIDIIY